MENLRNELLELKIKHGIVEMHPCSLDEAKQYEKLKSEGLSLPDNIMMQFNGLYVCLKETNLMKQEIDDLLLLRKIEYERIQTDYLKIQNERLNTIKNGMIFFVLLTMASLCIGIYLLLNGIF